MNLELKPFKAAINAGVEMNSKQAILTILDNDPSHLRPTPYRTATIPELLEDLEDRIKYTTIERAIYRFFIVSEMVIPGHNIAFRYDWAHLGAKITFEFDGFEAHRRLDDFNKDRVKHRHALQNGWLNVPVTNRDVRYNLIGLMAQVEEIISTRSFYGASVKKKGMTQYIWIEH